jgi:hypothetical protein
MVQQFVIRAIERRNHEELVPGNVGVFREGEAGIDVVVIESAVELIDDRFVVSERRPLLQLVCGGKSEGHEV